MYKSEIMISYILGILESCVDFLTQTIKKYDENEFIKVKVVDLIQLKEAIKGVIGYLKE